MNVESTRFHTHINTSHSCVSVCAASTNVTFEGMKEEGSRGDSAHIDWGGRQAAKASTGIMG